MTSFSHLSYPIDHYDPFFRLMSEDAKEVWNRVEPFLDVTVSPKSLRQLGDSLAPSEKDESSARKVVDKVNSLLQHCPTISIDRCCVSGSLGKHSSLVQFDIDLVIFVNGSSPPFQEIIGPTGHDD